LLKVNGDAEIHLRTPHAHRLAVENREAVVHLREAFERAQDGEGDEVRERGFAALVLLQELVDDEAVLFQDLDGHLAVRGRRRHAERCLHVLDDLERAAANRLGLAARLRGRGRRGLWPRRRGLAPRARGGRTRRARHLRRGRLRVSGRRLRLRGRLPGARVFGLRDRGRRRAVAARRRAPAAARRRGGLAEQLREVRAPGLVNERRVAAVAVQKALDVSGVRAEI